LFHGGGGQKGLCIENAKRGYVELMGSGFSKDWKNRSIMFHPLENGDTLNL
jgi:hypothetical protein